MKLSLLFIFIFFNLMPHALSAQKFSKIFYNKEFVRQIRPKNIGELYKLTRLLIPLDLKMAKFQIKRLEKQKLDKKMKLKTDILQSFIFLKENKISLSINILERALKESKKIKDHEILSFIQIQLARLYASNKNFALALKKYQSIDKNSKYYKDSLFETVSLLSNKSGDYKNTIEHIDALILLQDAKNSRIEVPNDREILDLILEKAKLYLIALELDKAKDAYDNFFKKYNIIKTKYNTVPNIDIKNDKIILNKCKFDLKDSLTLLFSNKCIKKNPLEVWLTKKEKLNLVSELKTFIFLYYNELLDGYQRNRYSFLLKKYINSLIETANSKITSQYLEAKTGLLQVKIARKDVKKERKKESLEKKYKKLNRLEKRYKDLFTDI